MGDLNSRRGRVEGVDADGDTQTVKARVPLAEMLTYGSTLRSITQGRGSFHMEYSHYEEVPRNAAGEDHHGVEEGEGSGFLVDPARRRGSREHLRRCCPQARIAQVLR